MSNLFLIAATLAIAACTRPAAPTRIAQQSTSIPAAEAAPAATTLDGEVTEKIDAAHYSYLKLQTGSGEVWAAVPRTDKEVGDKVKVASAVWMTGFTSRSMNRTWDKIAFGTLEEGAPAVLPAGHPAIGSDPAQGMFAQAAAGKAATAQHPAPAAAADLGNIKVARASGPQGRTVVEVWSKRASLKDQKVAVRGKVVKATDGVMGKNWLHVKDGTGEGAQADLTVASDDTAAVGSTVVITGVVHLDKDLGAGYHYDLIVEDATLKHE